MLLPHISKTRLRVSLTRSICLTKNYCSAECSIADGAAHAVCCQDLLNVDPRKLKVGGKGKVEHANEKLEAWKAELLEGNGEQFSKNFTEVVSKVNKVKLKDRNTEHEMNEVD